MCLIPLMQKMVCTENSLLLRHRPQELSNVYEAIPNIQDLLSNSMHAVSFGIQYAFLGNYVHWFKWHERVWIMEEPASQCRAPSCSARREKCWCGSSYSSLPIVFLFDSCLRSVCEIIHSCSFYLVIKKCRLSFMLLFCAYVNNYHSNWLCILCRE